MLHIIFRKLKKDPEEGIPSGFVKGAILKSLTGIFGEIGGQTEVDLLKFDEKRRKGILRVPVKFGIKTRTALIFIPEFQEIPAIFQVNHITNHLPALLETFIEF